MRRSSFRLPILSALVTMTGLGALGSAAAAGLEAPKLPLTDASAEHLTDDALTEARRKELRDAVRKGSAAHVRQALASGLTPNLLMENGDTLFTYAMRTDEVSVAQALLEAEGFDADRANRFGETPLMLAVFKGNETFFERLLEMGATPKGVPGAWTALHYAATQGRAKFVKALIERGADVNAQTAAGVTPLMMAARKPSRTVVQDLLRAGAYRDYCTDKGLSPADFAKKAGDDELAEYLAVSRCAVTGLKSLKK